MPINIVVCAKQVVDPETPASAFRIDPDTKSVVPAAGIPPVVNGFDENAVEAALQLKEADGAKITVVSVGNGFVMDVMKKPLSMGADELILVDDPLTAELDAFATAQALAEAIKKVGDFDLVLCGRQASDWDNSMVPLGVAELLGLPCVTMAQKIETQDGGIVVQRALTDGYEVIQAPLPRPGYRQQRTRRAALPYPARHNDGRQKAAHHVERVRHRPGRVRSRAQTDVGRPLRAGKRQAV